ncbi:hypothetical protein B0H14DRAFT_2608230 [Mycena olivaceomarginata]|nr:hypothetical protein B0H14DRAFT_2608230 [Mycena olivaceomarginata]
MPLALSSPSIIPAVLISPDKRSPVIASTWSHGRRGPGGIDTAQRWELSAGSARCSTDGPNAPMQAALPWGALDAVGVVSGGAEQKGKEVLEPEEDPAKEREVGPELTQDLLPRGCWTPSTSAVQRASKGAGAADAGGGLSKTGGARRATADAGLEVSPNAVGHGTGVAKAETQQGVAGEVGRGGQGRLNAGGSGPKRTMWGIVKRSRGSRWDLSGVEWSRATLSWRVVRRRIDMGSSFTLESCTARVQGGEAMCRTERVQAGEMERPGSARRKRLEMRYSGLLRGRSFMLLQSPIARRALLGMGTLSSIHFVRRLAISIEDSFDWTPTVNSTGVDQPSSKIQAEPRGYSQATLASLVIYLIGNQFYSINWHFLAYYARSSFSISDTTSNP